jgi:hypothetical protein
MSSFNRRMIVAGLDTVCRGPAGWTPNETMMPGRYRKSWSFLLILKIPVPLLVYHLLGIDFLLVFISSLYR